MAMKLMISLAISLSVAECRLAQYTRPDAGPTDHLLPTWDVDFWLDSAWIDVFGGANKKSLTECRDLLVAEQKFPTQTLFDPERFNNTCDRLAGDDMVKVQRDISGLPVPSAEALAAAAAATGKSSFLDNLVETYDEEWTAMVPPGGHSAARPRPAYTVGFRAEAFTATQLAKLAAIDAAAAADDTNHTGLSLFRATPTIYFPFMSFCAATSHNPANNSVWMDCVGGMAGGTRAIEWLYTRLGRQTDMFNHIWTFSVTLVRDTVDVQGVSRCASMPGYKPEHLRGYELRNDSALARWDSFRFVKNVYETWAPRQLEHVRALLDQIPLSSEPGPEPEFWPGAVAVDAGPGQEPEEQLYVWSA